MIEVYLMDLPEGVDFYNFKDFSGYSYVIFGNRKISEQISNFAEMRAIENSLMTKDPELILQHPGIMRN